MTYLSTWFPISAQRFWIQESKSQVRLQRAMRTFKSTIAAILLLLLFLRTLKWESLLYFFFTLNQPYSVLARDIPSFHTQVFAGLNRSLLFFG